MDSSSRSTVLEAVNATYRPQIESLLGRAGEILVGRGYGIGREIDDLADDEYSYSLNATSPAGAELGLTITIAESSGRDGESEFGINFIFDVVGAGGRIFIDWSPYNFTDRVWVDARDAAAVQERFEMFSAIDLEGALIDLPDD